MTTFKIGDRLLCKRDLTKCGGPAVGEVKTVTSVAPNGRYVRFDGLSYGHFPTDFELVEAKTPYQPKAGSRLDQALTHFLSGKTLTQGEAIILGYGTRLAATVKRLRDRGHNIVTTMKEDLKGYSYAEYRLVTRRPSGDRKAA